MCVYDMYAANAEKPVDGAFITIFGAYDMRRWRAA